MIDGKLLPPCMKAILGDLRDRTDVGHPARFAFASFALKAGVSQEDVGKAFIRQANYQPTKTGDILRDMVERDYMPPSCSRMASQGICPVDAKVPLCSAISNPLSFFRARSGDSSGSRKTAEPVSLGAAEPLIIGKCECGYTSRPLPRTVQVTAMNGHYWSAPAAEEDKHVKVEYTDLEGKVVTV